MTKLSVNINKEQLLETLGGNTPNVVAMLLIVKIRK